MLQKCFLRGDLLYVFPCVILFLCFSVLFVRLFGLCFFRFVGFLFLLGSEKGCGLWLWHSLDFSLISFFRLTFFYQGTVSAIKFRKRLTKFKITIALPKKFGSKGFITTVEVTTICRSSGESNKLRYIYPIWSIAIQKIKIVPFIINFGGNCTIRYTKIQIKKWCLGIGRVYSVVYSTDRSKAVVPVLVLLFVALWFILRGDLFYVLPCVILFLCFSVLLALRLPRLRKRELILVHFIHFFDLCLFGFVGYLFLFVSWKSCGLRLWHSLDFSLTFFVYFTGVQ